MDGDTVELTGHYQESCGTDRQLRGTLRDFTTWHAEPDDRLDRAVAAWGTAGNIGDRTRVALDGEPIVLIEGQHRRDDFRSWRTYAYDPVTGRAGSLTPRTQGGSEALANPSATVLATPEGRSALLVSLFVPREGGRRAARRDSSSTGANCEHEPLPGLQGCDGRMKRFAEHA